MSLDRRFAFLTLCFLAGLGAACSGSNPESEPAREPAVATGPSDPPDASPDPASGPSPGPAVAGADAGPRDAAPDGDGGKRVCNALVNVAPQVTLVAEASDPPTALGGAIADGTYVLTSATVYTGAAGASGPTLQKIQMTIAVAGTHLES